MSPRWSQAARVATLAGSLRAQVAQAWSLDDAWATQLLDDFRNVLHKIWLVKPKAASLAALADELRRAA